MDTVATTVIEIPPYLTPWDIEDEIDRCLRRMKQTGGLYLLDMFGVKNVYSATARLITRLCDRAARLGARVFIVNAAEPVQNGLRSLQLHTRAPILGTTGFRATEVSVA